MSVNEHGPDVPPWKCRAGGTVGIVYADDAEAAAHRFAVWHRPRRPRTAPKAHPEHCFECGRSHLPVSAQRVAAVEVSAASPADVAEFDEVLTATRATAAALAAGSTGVDPDQGALL